MPSKQQTSVAMFLAVANLASGSAIANPEPMADLAQRSTHHSELLAQATNECVPVGEGENCARPRRRKKPANTNPAANTSEPVTDHGAKSGTSMEVLNQVERGNL